MGRMRLDLFFLGVNNKEYKIRKRIIRWNQTERVIDGNAMKRKDVNTMERNKNGQTDFIEQKEGWVWKDIWNGNQRQCRKHEQVRWWVTKCYAFKYPKI